MPDMTNAVTPEFQKTDEFMNLYQQFLRKEIDRATFESSVASAADAWAASADTNPVEKHRS